jgi:TfoX/Sxy family transcriptional regulator of competence genes
MHKGNLNNARILGGAMASQQSTVDYIVEQMAGAGSVSAKKMFGEFGIFLDGKMVAVVCDDQLFVKPTKAGRAYMETVVEAAPFPGAKPYFLIDGGLWDEHEWLSQLVKISALELPLPKKKKT